MMTAMRSKTVCKLAALTVVAGLGLSACQNAGTKETIGGATGAVLGGVAGAQFGKGKGQLIATGAGAVLGALLGSSVGRSLDEVDRMKMQRTTQRTLEAEPDNTTSTWVNPNTDNSGTVTPVKTYQRDDGRYCREYQQTITVGGKTEQAYGTACRQPDGSWKIVS